MDVVVQEEEEDDGHSEWDFIIWIYTYMYIESITNFILPVSIDTTHTADGQFHRVTERESKFWLQIGDVTPIMQILTLSFIPNGCSCPRRCATADDGQSHTKPMCFSVPQTLETELVFSVSLWQFFNKLKNLPRIFDTQIARKFIII